MNAPYVIIGGDAAGMSAASKLKRDLPEATVIVFERGSHISYSACGMPYWIGGDLDSDRHLVVLTPEIARKRRHIDVRIGHEVTSIDAAAKTVHGARVDTGEAFAQTYGKLLIATGASTIRPPIPGLALPGVFTLRSLDDGQRIHRYVEDHAPTRGLVVGAGYIGVEMVEAFRNLDLETHLIELLPQIMPNFDPEMVELPATNLAEHGVHVHLGARVEKIEASGRALAVTLSDRTDPLLVDLVVVATGVRPNTVVAETAGIALGATGAIAVDSHMRTSVPDIFAAGDCVEHHHYVLGKPAWIPLATSANKGGRVAGENMAGEASEFPGILGTAVVKVFDYTMASTGLTENAARQSAVAGDRGEYVASAVIDNPDKAGYWPTASPLKVKLVFDQRDGRVLGGQIVGKEGVNKRIDIIATAITAHMNVADIGMLDLSYSPPYSPTYDPIQICANVALRSVGSTR